MIFRMLLLGTSRWPPAERDSAAGAAAGAAGAPLPSAFFGASAFLAPPAGFARQLPICAAQME